jgi:predicted phosphodiesterase
MRIRIFSDLHLEFAPFDPPEMAADAVVLAGDIHNGAAGIEWAKARFDAPILYIPGNHESYGADFHASRRALADAADGMHVTLLDCGERVIDGVRFLGCTLWTDFDLAGETGRALALGPHFRRLVDFRAIRWRGRLFSPDDSMQLHSVERTWLEARLLAEHFSGPTVVITHHAPHPGSIAPAYATHPLNPAFVSDLDELMGHATLWIHGHTHAMLDYTVRGTRVVCNARGYPGEATGFRPDLVVEV